MASTLKHTFSHTVDGVALPFIGSLVKSLSVDELVPFKIEKADDGDDTTFSELLGTGEFSTITALLITSDRAIKLRLNDQSDGHIPISAAGWVVLTDVAIDDATSKVKVNNNSGAAAVISGYIAGT